LDRRSKKYIQPQLRQSATPSGLDQSSSYFLRFADARPGELYESGNSLTMEVMLIRSGQYSNLFDASISLPELVTVGKLAIGLTMILTARRTACWILGDTMLAR
jgi:hypothetical protein